MADVASLIREAKLPERTVPICLRADLVSRYHELSARLDRIKDANQAADSMVGEDQTPLTAEKAALEGEMRAATVPFVLRALSRPRFRDLIAQHPPRKDDEGNVVQTDWIGVDTSRFYDVLIRQTVVEPQLDEETWQLLLNEKLTDRQYNDLAEAGWDLCRDKVDIPFLSID